MKKFFTVCAIALVFASCSESPVDNSSQIPANTPAKQNSEYLRPLANGNVWWYIVPNPDDPNLFITRRDTVQITGEIEAEVFRIHTDSTGTDTSSFGVRKIFPFVKRGVQSAYALLFSGVCEGELSPDKTKFYYNDYYLVPKEPVINDSSWFSVPTLSTLAGNFTDLLMYQEKNNQGTFRTYFKRGVGLVRMEQVYLNSGKTVRLYELQYYNLK